MNYTSYVLIDQKDGLFVLFFNKSSEKRHLVVGDVLCICVVLFDLTQLIVPEICFYQSFGFLIPTSFHIALDSLSASLKTLDIDNVVLLCSVCYKCLKFYTLDRTVGMIRYPRPMGGALCDSVSSGPTSMAQKYKCCVSYM